MFSGICEAAGIIKQAIFVNDCLHLTIFTPVDFTDLKIGDSVAVNGVCLTITELLVKTFSVVIIPETLRLTTLQNVKSNELVNLERAVKLETRIGGHYVQGHVDGRGEIIDLQHDGSEALLVTIRVDPTLTKYIVAKGYIAIDGMSITVIKVTRETFTVTFIPHTQAATIVHQYQQHQLVNIEVDILGKYIEKLLGANQHAISSIQS